MLVCLILTSISDFDSRWACNLRQTAVKRGIMREMRFHSHVMLSILQLSSQRRWAISSSMAAWEHCAGAQSLRGEQETGEYERRWSNRPSKTSELLQIVLWNTMESYTKVYQQ